MSDGDGGAADIMRASRAAGMLLNATKRNNRPDPWATIAALSPDEMETMIESFATKDTNASKTWTRIVVEKFLMNYNWYFPLKGTPNAPSLSKAYAYYEHISLPRHFAGGADHIMRRAEPGETEKTELYHPLLTSSSNFIEWGIGVDLYFSTLRIMALVLFLAGLLHLPNQIFYRRSYNPEPKNIDGISLSGSAVCTSSEWVACDNCTQSDWSTFDEKERFATVEAADGSTFALLQRLTCNGGELTHGLINWGVLFFLTGVLFLLAIYLGAREVRFDEDQVTSTDYTLVVKNPPEDAYDPDEWRDYFSQFGDKDKNVTAVTVGLNNELMLRLLIARRTHRNTLRLMLPKGIDMDDEDAVRIAVSELVREREGEPIGCLWKIFSVTGLPILQLFNYLLPPEVLVDRVFSLTERIKVLQKEKYSVSRVFVTFETEEFARTALETLSIPLIDVFMGNTGKYQHLTFKGKLLHVEEPVEPSAIRWLNLSSTSANKLTMRAINFVVTIGVVAFCGFIVSLIRFRNGVGNAWAAASMISIFNVLIPLIIKILMIFEPHATEGGFQTSLYLKITLFRWVNTALLIKLTTPWTNTLQSSSKDVLPQINAILWSELYLVPLLRLLDIWGNFCKHFLAPRARTQEEMNLSFQGTRYNLGERYTDLTKVLFVCFFYSSLYPASFFFGTAILIVQYYTDKYCLMRIWANSPFIGAEVARFSRRYFFSGAVVAYAVINAYIWSGFPYSNLCEVENPTIGAAGTYSNLTLGTGEMSTETIVVEQDAFVQFCDQSWRIFEGALKFPPTGKQQPEDGIWMSDSQALLSSIFGITAAVYVGGYILLLFSGVIMQYVSSFFCGFYKPTGEMQYIDFSSNTEIFAYIPQVKEGGFPFPFLACDIDEIDQSLVGWNDPSRSYDYYNLIFDLEWEGMPRKKIIEMNTRGHGARISDHTDYRKNSTRHIARRSVDRTPIFSVIRHYPPSWVLELRARDAESK